LSETWLNSSIPDSLFNDYSRYIVFRCDRPSRGGVVCLLINKLLASKCIRIDLPTEYNLLEILAIDFCCCNCKTRIILLYRPPHTAVDNIYQTKLVNCLRFLSISCSRLIIVGDFNLPEVDWKTGSFPNKSGYSPLCDFLIE